MIHILDSARLPLVSKDIETEYLLSLAYQHLPSRTYFNAFLIAIKHENKYFLIKWRTLPPELLERVKNNEIPSVTNEELIQIINHNL